MANPKWGTKRICQSCGTKFYDLTKSPIVCPSCGTEFDPEALLKSRRPRSAPKAEPAPKAKKPKLAAAAEGASEASDEEFEIEDDEADVAVAEGEEDDFIEDTGDLGEDDMSDVVVEEEEDEA